MVWATIGTVLGGFALDVVKSKAGDAIDQKLSDAAVKAAIQEAVGAADSKVPELLLPYEKQGWEGSARFLHGAFRGVAIAELQKPLQDEGKPDDALLTQVFVREAKNHSNVRSLAAASLGQHSNRASISLRARLTFPGVREHIPRG